MTRTLTSPRQPDSRGYSVRMFVHGCSSAAQSRPLGVSREITEIMLNHVTGGGKTDLDEIYDRYGYLPEKRAALQRLEAHVKKLVAA